MTLLHGATAISAGGIALAAHEVPHADGNLDLIEILRELHIPIGGSTILDWTWTFLAWFTLINVAIAVGRLFPIPLARHAAARRVARAVPHGKHRRGSRSPGGVPSL